MALKEFICYIYKMMIEDKRGRLPDPPPSIILLGWYLSHTSLCFDQVLAKVINKSHSSDPTLQSRGRVQVNNYRN